METNKQIKRSYSQFPRERGGRVRLHCFLLNQSEFSHWSALGEWVSSLLSLQLPIRA
jgi:hypothetical protein